MGIWISVQTPDRKLISINDDNEDAFISKAIVHFLTPIEFACPPEEYENSKPQDEQLLEAWEWIGDIRSQMTEDICLISKACFGFWEYSRSDYDQYLVHHESLNDTRPPKTRQEFLAECDQDEVSWVETLELKDTVDELVKVLKNIDSDETWFYYPEVTIKDFEDLSTALEIALMNDHQEARLWIW